MGAKTATAAPRPDLPVWRSLLYVPAHIPRFIDKAHIRGANAIILDLEDSVPAAGRDRARALVAESADKVLQGGADVLVRINRPDAEAEKDLSAAVIPGVTALMLPKVGDGKHVCAIADPRNVAATLGGEAFAAAGMVPDPETLFLPKLLTLFAARAAGIVPLCMIGNVADYQYLEAVRDNICRSRRFGFEGASCIHPSVVPLLNEEMSPSPEGVSRAEGIVDAYGKAKQEGIGAIAVDGMMIDVPVAERAKALLRRHAAIRARDAKSGDSSSSSSASSMSADLLSARLARSMSLPLSFNSSILAAKAI